MGERERERGCEREKERIREREGSRPVTIMVPSRENLQASRESESVCEGESDSVCEGQSESERVCEETSDDHGAVARELAGLNISGMSARHPETRFVAQRESDREPESERGGGGEGVERETGRKVFEPQIRARI